SSDADRLSLRRVDRPGDQSWRALRAPWPHPRRDVRRGVQVDARRRLLSGEGWARADRDPKARFGLDRVRPARTGGPVVDARGPVHGRRGYLRLLRAATLPAQALR